MQLCNIPSQFPLAALAHDVENETVIYICNEIDIQDIDFDAGACFVYREHENEYTYEFDNDNSTCMPDTEELCFYRLWNVYVIAQ